MDAITVDPLVVTWLSSILADRRLEILSLLLKAYPSVTISSIQNLRQKYDLIPTIQPAT
jgi:hypothetical protein